MQRGLCTMCVCRLYNTILVLQATTRLGMASALEKFSPSCFILVLLNQHMCANTYSSDMSCEYTDSATARIAY